jgi:hypothetical protein
MIESESSPASKPSGPRRAGSAESWSVVWAAGAMAKALDRKTDTRLAPSRGRGHRLGWRITPINGGVLGYLSRKLQRDAVLTFGVIGHSLPIDGNAWFIPNHPSVMACRDDAKVTRAKLHFLTVVQRDRDSS